ncbi:LysR family transcriptional regulator [Burkholderia sp. NLJ2]|uniref:LysR family transcriptional regulator n=1 Tax=Burkholderia sp. NLJ2 TaxID=3090699 RepID=UPI003C6C7E58
MEAKWLEDFLSLADTRSFSLAARTRHLTQSAFSRRISALESWLGAKLIDRSVSPVRLTSTGWMFRSLAADILRSIYAARTLANGHEPLANDAAVVRFAVAHTLVFTFIPNCLKQLSLELGQLKAKVLAVNVPEGIQELVDGGCDLLIAYHHPQLPILLDPNHFPFLTLSVERILPVSAPDEHGKPIYMLPGRTNEPLPFMAYSSGAFLGNVVEMLLMDATEPYSLRRTFETHMSEALKAMVVAGNGVGWLPESCISRELADGSIVQAGSGTWITELEVRLYRCLDKSSAATDKLWNHISLQRHRNLGQAA